MSDLIERQFWLKNCRNICLGHISLVPCLDGFLFCQIIDLDLEDHFENFYIRTPQGMTLYDSVMHALNGITSSMSGAVPRSDWEYTDVLYLGNQSHEFIKPNVGCMKIDQSEYKRGTWDDVFMDTHGNMFGMPFCWA